VIRAPVRVLAVALLLCAGVPARAIPQVFLVQNSGWMEPFYSDPHSPFKPLVAALVVAAAQPGDPVLLAAFNQALAGNPSPRALLSQVAAPNTLPAAVKSALAGLDTARKPGGGALADTDLGQALQAAIATALAGRPGIVWLVTNNRNSPNNDQATARRNREFYALIHEGREIDEALAFPLRMPVQGAHYRANGLMVYAFGVGAQGAAALNRLLAAGGVRQVFTEPPARLKPLDRDTVRLAPRRVEDAPGVAFSMSPGGLVADVDADARSPSARVGWNLENTIYPYTIAAASLTARSVLAGEDRPIALAKSRVAGLDPGRPQPLASTMQLPVARMPSAWSLAALRSAGSAYVLPGRIELHLAGQKLALSRAFRERMQELFPGDPLPEIFTPPARIKDSTALLPIEVRVHYPLRPLALIGGAGLLALLGAAGGAYALTRPRRVLVTVEDEPRTVYARAGATQPILDKDGNQVARLKTTLFGHRLIDLREGARVRLGR
jgi:hypothetical protein